ncbi:MAG TPA: ATP-binding protein [Casimicrobiaceae bacterium]|nr:ATP-binding protein [Casimicrobiaceae bacterium]
MTGRSIRRELFLWLAAALVVAVAAASVATYMRARQEANEIFDYQLRQMAASLTGVPLAGTPGGLVVGDDALVVQVWDRNGVQLFLSQPRQPLPQYAQLGFNTVKTANGDWRVFSTLADDQVVQVAQPMSARRELATSMALRTIVPLLVVAPLLALFVGWGVMRGLAPLARLASAVAKRTPAGLEPLDEAGLPEEVRPLAQALNGLLARLDRALGAQRAFIADAAHELRTPLTAVHLQAQLAERAPDDAARGAALAELRAGVTRATHLVEQMLTLAREEPGVAERTFAPVNLTDLARSVVGEHAAIAAARGVDLGTAGAAADAPGVPVVLDGDATGLRALVSNLVDNAIRYTPSGGRVDVTVERDGGDAVFAVRDTGPGIPAGERARVFDRFYRAPPPGAADVPGSGLGLAIVKRIAERHDATIELGPGIAGPAGDGLTVTVRFPRTSA